MIFEVLIKNVLLLIVNQLDLGSLGQMAQVSRMGRRLVGETKRYQEVRNVEASGEEFTRYYHGRIWRLVQACQMDYISLETRKELVGFIYLPQPPMIKPNLLLDG